jgi:hypothetical protein
MIFFKDLNDLSQLPPGSPGRFLLKSLLERLAQVTAPGEDPEDHGYVVLIEPLDVYREEILPELPCPLADVPWEGVVLSDGYFHAVVITNNSFAIDVVIPNANWLSETIRSSLKKHLSQF